MRFEEIKEKIKNLEKIAEGWRGEVYKGEWEGKIVAVKVAKRKEVEEAIKKEAKILEELKGIEGFPQIVMSGEDFVMYEFIEGELLGKFKGSREEFKNIVLQILDLAYLLDNKGIKKDEFAYLDKNVIIGKNGKVYLIDFERGNFSKRPSNIPQFLQFLVKNKFITRGEAIELGKRYKEERERVYEEIRQRIIKS